MEFYVIKSNWKKESFDVSKIRSGIFKAFKAVNVSISDIESIVQDVINIIQKDYISKNIDHITSKELWDLVETILMQHGYYDVAKAFISYRLKQALEEKEFLKKNFKVIKRSWKKEDFDIKKIKKLFNKLTRDLPDCDWKSFSKELKKYLINNISTEQILNICVKAAIDNISVNNISWQNLAGRFILADLYAQAVKNRKIDFKMLYSPEAYLDLFKEYVKKKLYFPRFFDYYTEDDILQAAKWIDKKRDYEYGFTTMNMYKKRYLLNPNWVVKELPQEMYLSIALFLAIPEGSYDFKNWKKEFDFSKKWKDLDPEKRKKRLEFARKVYEYTSSWKISLPTPTLLNARTAFHQLSSCFKLNVDDDLRWIYHAIENMAQISKFWWWIWSYLWHIRAKGSEIRWRKWASGGVLPWIKVMNDTAIAVNQLGARAGAISVTLDIWHLDILDFLEMQTETWDIRRKAFDVFPAISIPDLFMKRVLNDEDWTLFDPKELRDVLWYRLEDFRWEEFEKRYIEAEQNSKIKLRQTIKAKELFKHFLKTVVETWMPYVFFRDTSNKYNPNKHAWMVYSTQLCTEIIQNTKEPKFVEETVEDWKVVIKYQPGELVTCNLASINIAKVYKDKDIAEVIPVAMRILDNVIDLNFYPIQESKLTAKKYRPVWLWFMWLAEHLATQMKLRYDSSQAVGYVDKLFEKYAYHTLKASVELAKERWPYSLFEGSDWSKWILRGKDEKWFKENSEYSQYWVELIKDIKKYWVRFWYHQAPAPNTSTSLVVGTTAGVLPVYKKYFVETNSKWVNVNVAPNLSQDNFWYYKEYIHMKMDEVIDVIAAIQKWIDQSISFEWLFNPMETSPVDLFNRYIKAWKKWIKTIYYVRSMSLEVEKCESCAG